MESNTEQSPKGSAGGESRVPRRKAGTSGKWFAIILVLVVIIAALLAANFVKPPAAPSTTPSVVSAPSAVSVGEVATISLQTSQSYQQATFYFGDGTSTVVKSAGTNSISVTHTWNNPGSYYVLYSVNYGNGVTYTNYNQLIQVSVGTTNVPSNAADGVISLVANQSSPQLINNYSNAFSPGSNAVFLLGFAEEPADGVDVVYYQQVTVYYYNAPLIQKDLNYQFSAVNGYVLSPSQAFFNLTDMKYGLYSIGLTTYTGTPSATGAISAPSAITTVFTTVPVFTNAQLYVAPTKTTTLTNAEVVSGGYKTFDGAIAYDTVSNEVLYNTNQYLVMYNGSSSSSFAPELAAYLPTVANGGINNNTKTYTEVNAQGIPYTVNLQPYQNYTFHIRANATWQNGAPVTGYDVAYSMYRTLLFVNGAPGTPGWIEAQALLPNYIPFVPTTENTFYNLLHNITWNNASNTVTFHFQSPEAADFVFEILAASGDFVMDPAWMAQHGGAIPWSPAGFVQYQAEGSASGYNTYFINHIFANGPYELYIAIPGTEVVLKANPDFNSPGPWYPKASIGVVTLLYLSSFTTSYLLLKSGGAQLGGISTGSWNEALGLQSAGIVKIHAFPTLSIFWYNFNAFVNMTEAAVQFPGINMPAALFANHYVREAFAYAYNYQYYINQQIGNAVFNATFAYTYAGMLPAGMLYSQNISTMNTTMQSEHLGAVPYFSMSQAEHYWGLFQSSGQAAAMGINSKGVYKGAQLELPIIVFSPDPTDVAGATSWAYNLSLMIFGTPNDFLQFPATPFPFVSILTDQIAPSHVGNVWYSNDPMPIYILGWAPDYPYPSDYLGPMGVPGATSLYPGANAMFPAIMKYLGHPAQAAVMNQMISEYTNATYGPQNAASVSANYTLMNYWIVNQTWYVYLFQQAVNAIVSTKLNQNQFVTYQENVMIGGGGDMLYNLLSYT